MGYFKALETNYSWIVPFSWVICMLRVVQILSIESSVWTLLWTCRLNEFHLTSKRHVTNRTAQKQQEFLILRRHHHGTDRQLFHYFLRPGDTRIFIIMVNSQLSKQNVHWPVLHDHIIVGSVAYSVEIMS